MSHYYSEKNDDVKSNIQKITIRFQNLELPFFTDNGVFCKDYLDFGTRVLLENTIIYGSKVLDLGCGYGPVGVILGKLNPSLEITMVDINERAVALAQRNALANNVSATVLKSNILADVSSSFSCILTNPPIRAGKATVFAFYDQSYDHLEKNGVIYVVIQKKQGALSSLSYLESKFGNCEVICKEKGYFILKSVK